MIWKPNGRSSAAAAYRHLYKTTRWLEIRADQLRREPLCAMCEQRGIITAATVCNHLDREAKATPEGFFAGPFNSLCAPCHDGAVQSFERTGRMRGHGEDGAPLDPNHPWNRA